MAKDKESGSGKGSAGSGPITGERIITIPLRAGWSRAPAGKRTNRAVNDIKRFLIKHLKTDDVKISEKLNNRIWKRGKGKPPASVKVKVSVKEGVASARLPDEIVIDKKKQEKKSTAPKSKVEELRQKAEEMRSAKKDGKGEDGKKDVEKDEVKKDVKKGDAKKDDIEDKGIKDVKKDGKKEEEKDKIQKEGDKEEPKKLSKPEEQKKGEKGSLKDRITGFVKEIEED